VKLACSACCVLDVGADFASTTSSNQGPVRCHSISLSRVQVSALLGPCNLEYFFLHLALITTAQYARKYDLCVV
jgi:hypothetical protein